MINTAQFRIIGRIGSITRLEKLTRISIASDRNLKDNEGNWSTETNWNSIAVFSEAIRKRLSNDQIAKQGNQLIIEGTIQSSSYEKGGSQVYSVDLIAQEMEILSFAKSS